MSESRLLLEDIWEVKQLDQDGKKFDKVSRIECKSENYEMDLVLDVNTDIYPIEVSDKLTLALATSVDLNDNDMDPTVSALYDRKLGTSQKPSLLDRYEYAMYGKVYKYKTDKIKEHKVSVYVSFGGLLMKLSGDPRNMQAIDPDMHLYLLVRKAK
eukprot:CAMPEP_0117442966 /NCGR_PEP_ID=MMETSP0759-20121206/4439_1 /TAXON_ID=63605 /ORGANISM="Percolomonas cosmopolitus, Strain WS" /LENGTH=155 /DNA_ID=CAMNT_0005234901 /DNA_START=48 /DNA_END=515 /DNA_ORIENTATION=+